MSSLRRLASLVVAGLFASVSLPVRPVSGTQYPLGSPCIDSCFPEDPSKFVDKFLEKWEPTVVDLVSGTIPWSQDGTVNFPRLYMQPVSGPMIRTISGMQVLWLNCTGPTADTCPPVKLSYHNRNSGPDIIHGHGLTPPYIFDGVPFISATPAQPGGWYNISYNLTSSQSVGTYFVHSHYAFNHDDGMTIPFILKGPVDSTYPQPYRQILNDPDTTDLVVMLEDFCPYGVNDMQPVVADPTVPIPGYCGSANDAFITLHTEWIDGKARYDFVDPQSGALNFNGPDIQYTAQFANFRRAENAYSEQVFPGQNIRIRTINSGGMTEYQIQLPTNLTMTVVATDGFPITPVPMQTMWWIGVAQRHDFLVTIPLDAQPGTIYPINYAVEGTSFLASVVLYVGETAPAPWSSSMPTYWAGMGDPQAATYNFSFDMNLHYSNGSDPTGNPGLASEWQEWNMHATNPIGFTPATADYTYAVHLTGNNGFMSINYNSFQLPPMGPMPTTGSFVSNPVPLQVHQGDKVCLKFYNYDSDSHLMHLHGHTFQVMEVDGTVISGSGGARRDVVSMPRGDARTVTACFHANNPWNGRHPLHCHLQYHMMAGMFTTIEYVPQGQALLGPAPWPPVFSAASHVSSSSTFVIMIIAVVSTILSFIAL